MIRIERSEENPIIVPEVKRDWEAEATFNGCPTVGLGGIHLLYRAVSRPRAQGGAELNVSTVATAVSRDGVHFRDRRVLVEPEYDWEMYGCEDPRVTKVNGKYYIFYTALSKFPFGPEGIRVGLAITKDLKKIEEKHPITHFNSKAMALFPEKIKGKLTAILTVDTDTPPAKIAIVQFDKEEDMWSRDHWEKWRSEIGRHTLTLERGRGDHVEVGAPPVRTSKGWLLVHSYIQNYLTSGRPIFGVEAALLDLKDPRRVVAQTTAPFLVPEEQYELYGKIPNIVFPSGVLIRGDKLFIYYGAADTTVCLATTSVKALLKNIFAKSKVLPMAARFSKNPIIKPDPSHGWEAKATFNPAAIYEHGRVHLLYRAMSQDGLSVLGYASSRDGYRFKERLLEPVYRPRMDFEERKNPSGNAGCEDPRLTLIGSTLYMCYTAYDGASPPRVALTSISLKDFLAKRWRWAPPCLLSPPGLDDKDAALFPEKFGGKFAIIHRLKNDMDIGFVKKFPLPKNTWLSDTAWFRPRRGMWDDEKVGLAAPPIKTRAGWLMLYHGVSSADHQYRVGAALLALRDPKKVLARTDKPILEPTTDYEKQGQIANVVFPCGAVVVKNKLLVYYGGADTVVGVVTFDLPKLLAALQAA
ncbi:MAG TPA: hypothetical protein VMC43_02785 [Candidatus Paceibacterota bacterium]|nr:hypothetical protein [Candidatus Paceibacterota bacterium]